MPAGQANRAGASLPLALPISVEKDFAELTEMVPHFLYFLSHGEVPHLIAEYGYGAIAWVVALESTGLLPVPGETTHALSLWPVVAAAAGGAIIRDNIGSAKMKRR